MWIPLLVGQMPITVIQTVVIKPWMTTVCIKDADLYPNICQLLAEEQQSLKKCDAKKETENFKVKLGCSNKEQNPTRVYIPGFRTEETTQMTGETSSRSPVAFFQSSLD